MKGMLQRDWYGVRGWMVLAILTMLLGYPLSRNTQGSQIIYSVLPQLLAMLPVRTLVQADRGYGWCNMVNTLPHGRRRYATEKFGLLLAIGGVVVLVWLCTRAVGLSIAYQRYAAIVPASVAGTVPYPADFWGYMGVGLQNTRFLLVGLSYFFLLSAIQMPMLLLSSGWFANLWELLTWALSWVGILWMREGTFIRFLLHKESEAAVPRPLWQTYPWPTILAVTVVLFILSAGLTIYFSERVRDDGISPAQSMDVADRPIRSAFRKGVAFLVTAAVAVALGLCVRQALPMKTLYLYSTATDNPSFLITNQEPSEIAARPEYKGYIPRLWYHADYADAEIVGAAGNQCLVWDGGWLLVDLTSKEKTPVPIPGKPQLAYTQLLGEAAPTAVALWDEAAQAFAFYSFEAERLVTDYEYARFEDALVNGCIAAERLDGTMVYVDPADGMIVG